MVKHKKRICLFAGYNAKGCISEYVLYMLEKLSEVSDVYYLGDFEANSGELQKVKQYCQEAWCYRHKKYDFGSWQELINKIGWDAIEQYDELILANDSCYGPLFEFKDVFASMDKFDYDFWGLSSARQQHIHIQSYFIVLHQNVAKSPILKAFFSGVKKEKNFTAVCSNYEDQLTYLLSKEGFKFGSFIDYGDLQNHPYFNIEAAIKNKHFPLLKVKFFLGGIRDQVRVDDWRKMINAYSEYPISLIEEDLVSRGVDLLQVEDSIHNRPTLDQRAQNRSCRKVLHRLLKIAAYPVITVLDHYINNKLAPINHHYEKLEKKYLALRSEIQPDISQIPHNYTVQEDSKKDSLIQFEGVDAIKIKRYDLDLPLTQRSNILTIGNMSEDHVTALDIDSYSVLCLNNDWAISDEFQNKYIKNLSSFHITMSGNAVLFDLILVQPLVKDIDAEQLQLFINSLKKHLVAEGALILFVPRKEKQKYTTALSEQQLFRFDQHNGLIVSEDPFQVYYDKIGSIKDYEALIYKLM